MPVGNKSVLRCFRNVVRDSQERTLWGIEFHTVDGAAVPYVVQLLSTLKQNGHPANE